MRLRTSDQHLPHVGSSPGWCFLLPRAAEHGGGGGGGAQGPRSAWTSTSACPPAPRLGEQLVWMEKWHAVLLGACTPAQAFRISAVYPRAEPHFLRIEDPPKTRFLEVKQGPLAIQWRAVCACAGTCVYT